jgi:hypothetical protein
MAFSKRTLRGLVGRPSHLVARPVGNGLWMLYHTQFEQLLDDFGWFRSQREAEAQIAQLETIFGTPRRVFPAQIDPQQLN